MKEPDQMFRTVLFATDLSDESAHAIRWIRWLHNYYRAKVYVVHVLDRLPFGVGNEDAVKQKNAADRRLRTFVRTHRLDGDGFSSMLLVGDVVVLIEKLVENHDIDCIVLGNKSAGLNRLFLGSVSEEIFRSVDCPVLTVGPKVTSPSGTLGLKRLLFATDLSEQSRSAVEYLRRLLKIAPSAELAVAHFMPRDSNSVVARYKLRKQLQTKLIESIPDPLRKQVTEIIVESSSPAQGVIEFAKDWRTDLIVLGVRSGGPFTRAVTHGRPSITHRIVRSAVCPVLTIRS